MLRALRADRLPLQFSAPPRTSAWNSRAGPHRGDLGGSARLSGGV